MMYFYMVYVGLALMLIFMYELLKMCCLSCINECVICDLSTLFANAKDVCMNNLALLYLPCFLFPLNLTA